jgi:hypothetical protein
MDGDKDRPLSRWNRWLDYYRTPIAKFKPKTPSKVVDKKYARRYRRRNYDLKIEIEHEGI